MTEWSPIWSVTGRHPTRNHTGILYSPQFRSYKETNMAAMNAARRTHESTEKEGPGNSLLAWPSEKRFHACA